MRIPKGSFPYPVLGFSDSIGGKQPEVMVVDRIPAKERIADPYGWDFRITLNNPDIERLIEEGKASYLCEVQCSATFLRRCLTVRNSSFSLDFPRRSVNGRVEFSLWVVADEHIPDYKNAYSHADYKDLEPFDIAKGAPLAFLKSYHWDADLCYEDLTSLRSILRLEKSPDPKAEFPVVDTDGDYIALFLPPDQYDRFLDVAGQESVNSILHASILLFALQTALTRYAGNEEKRWARALNHIVSSDSSRFPSLELGNAEQAAELALRLLNNPTKRLSDEITAMAKGVAVAQAQLEQNNDE